jgi:hypothetical protein
MLTVPVNPVWVLLFASRAVMRIVKGVAAVCDPIAPPPEASTRKLDRSPGATANELLAPVCAPAVFVAMIVKFPVFEIVTLREASTPATNAGVVPPPAERIPVEVISTVPVKLVTVLFPASRAVILRLNAVPAVCPGIAPPAEDSTRKFVTPPAMTANTLLVPDSLPAVFVAVIVNVPVFDIVMPDEARTPPVNAALVPPPEERIPVEVIVTVPLNPVCVLLFASRAMILIVKGVPADCVGITPPTEFSTRKFASAPGPTANELLDPVCAPAVFVAVIVNDPVLEIVTPEDARTPLTNAALVPPPADRTPVDVMFTVPVKLVTVLFPPSRAVTFILNAVPAV